MTDLNNFTKPDILTLKEGDEILIRANVVHVSKCENSTGIVVTFDGDSVKSSFWVDRGCYFGRIEPDIPVSVGDKFRQPNHEICEVIGIDGDVYWIKVENGFRCVLTGETLRDYERLPK